MSKMYVSDLRQLLEDIAQEATLSAAKSVLDTLVPHDSSVILRSGSLSANTEETLVDIPGRPVDLESLAVGCDYMYVGIAIAPYLANGSLGYPLLIPTADGTQNTAVLPGNLNFQWGGENDFFKNFVYDENNDRFAMGMKRQAKFNNGVKITVKNYDTEAAHNAAVSLLISTWRGES